MIREVSGGDRQRGALLPFAGNRGTGGDESEQSADDHGQADGQVVAISIGNQGGDIDDQISERHQTHREREVLDEAA